MARRHRFLSGLFALTAILSTIVGSGVITTPASAFSPVPISGQGSTWSQNAIQQWITAVQQLGIKVNYTGNGSSAGRQAFLTHTTDFAASDIPFQSHPTDGSAPENPPAGSYAYIPVTAGGTTFMYNLTINGQRVTNLRLSGAAIAGIFSGNITNWDDPVIAKDNPQLALPNQKITPVVRSDGSGSSAQFSLWMMAEYPQEWSAFVAKAGNPGETETSYWPTLPGFVAQSGDLGVAGYVSQSFGAGSIGYVEYSYALEEKFPVALMLNAAGYYVEPTPNNVAVSLLNARVDTADVNDPSKYLTQDLSQVYTDPDPRVYPLSSYSYMVLPTATSSEFTTDKGATLAEFTTYAMCQGQQQMGLLGYSPMPINLVEDSFAQITKIPGSNEVATQPSISTCHNPTFDPNGQNLLAVEAPMPPACDKVGPIQCANGTGGASQPTALEPPASGSSGSGQAAGTGGGAGPATASTVPGAAAGSSATGAAGAAGSSATGASSAAAAASTATSTTTASSASGSNGTNGSKSASLKACNPDSGVCSSGSGGSPGSFSGEEAASSTRTLNAPHGWTGTQSLIVLVGILLLALLLGPGLIWRRLHAEDRA